MQPVSVIHILEIVIETRVAEAGVESRESGDETSEELFEGDGREVRGSEGGEGGGGEGVGGVEADADDGEVFGGGVVGVYEDAADFDVGV